MIENYYSGEIRRTLAICDIIGTKFTIHKLIYYSIMRETIMTKRNLMVIELSFILVIAMIVPACSHETLIDTPATLSAPITKTPSSEPVPTSIFTPAIASAPATESTPAPSSVPVTKTPSSTNLVSSKPIVLPGDTVIGSSASIINFTLEDLIKHTETAVIGKVVEILPPRKVAYKFSQDFIYTDVVIQAERYLYGKSQADRLAVRVDGGRIGDLVMVASDAPEFFLGEECIVFLIHSVHNYTAPAGFTDDNYYIVWADAKYNIREGILVNNSDKKFSLSDVEQEIAKTQKK
jgi:hypothetical protein